MQGRLLLLLCAFVLFATSFSLQALAQDGSLAVDRTLANSAVEKIGKDLPDITKAEVLEHIKGATDGIQLAIQSANNKDTSRMLKGIGDALSVLPGSWGFTGIAFSVAASVFAIFGGGGSGGEDPVLQALHDLHTSFNKEMKAIETSLAAINDKASMIISGIDRILDDISDIPSKVVAEMKLTDVTTMKDKFATVQLASQQYASGNLTRDQMVAKCDDFQVASLFSELETILKDEKDLFSAKFQAHDHLQGTVQLQLLVFYMSVIPLVTNCNSLKYSLDSIRSDGERIDHVVKFVYARAVWFLAEADRTVHVLERFSPFATAVDPSGGGTLKPQEAGWTLALAFKAYSFMPPHGICFEVVPVDGSGSGATRLVTKSLLPAEKVPNLASFCTKRTAADDAPLRIAYAEREKSDGGDSGLPRRSILQLEQDTNFDRLDHRGWTANSVSLYVSKAAYWTRLPLVRVISDLVVIQAKNAKVTVDEVTSQCQALGAGYDRDGDAHSQEYKGAPWTIFCVRYSSLTVREVFDTSSTKYLSDIQFNDMDSSDAWTATCPSDRGFVRDRGQITVPSKIKKHFFGGISTIRAYALCLQWQPMTTSSTPSQFMARVWLDDSAPMAEKPKQTRATGDQMMALPAPPSAAAFAAF